MENKNNPVDIQHLGWETFKQQLPELMTTHSGQWVAFRGENLIAQAPTQRIILRELVENEVPLEELLVRLVGPLGPPLDLRRFGIKVRGL